MRAFLALLFALTVSAPAAAQSVVPRLTPDETLLEVEATGSVSAVPDVLEISTAVTTDEATPVAALEANSRAVQRLIAAARAAGLSPTDVRTSALSVQPRERFDGDGDGDGEIVGFRARNQVTLRMPDISRAPVLIEALFAAGATDLSGPNFSFEDDASLRARARAAAVAEARDHAETYAEAMRMRIGRVLRISERDTSSYNNTEIMVTGSRAGGPPVEPGTQDVSVTVWVDFALLPVD